VTDLDHFRQSATQWAVGGDAEAGALTRTLARDIAAVILVEGVSDAAAIETLAELGGRDLAGKKVCVVPMGGVTNVAKFLSVLGPQGLRMRLAGLCDAGEERHVRRGLERAGLPPLTTRDEMAAAGFFVCVEDLEDELIRILGPARVQQILDAEGDLRAFHTFQNQPEKRVTPIELQLHRFLGTTAGRKQRYAKILVEGLDFPLVPQPLGDLLRFVS
jgi:hypothetical protein